MWFSGEIDRGVALKDHLHDFGIAHDFLFVSSRKHLDVDTRKQPLNVAIRKLGAFNAARERAPVPPWRGAGRLVFVTVMSATRRRASSPSQRLARSLR